jgi:menaquinone-dependent protoporphyrinogen oxidase
MKRFLVLYATREGHTLRIAEHLATRLRVHGYEPELIDAARAPLDLPVSEYFGAILAASVHKQKHEKEMVRFVKRHLAELERIPAAFLSVSLSEAGAEDSAAPAARRAKAASDAQMMIDTFLADTGWRPLRTRAVAGALLYSKYNFILRLLMKHIAGKAGGDTDTSRDYEYTNWQALDEFVDNLTSSANRPTQITPTP